MNLFEAIFHECLDRKPDFYREEDVSSKGLEYLFKNEDVATINSLVYLTLNQGYNQNKYFFMFSKKVFSLDLTRDVKSAIKSSEFKKFSKEATNIFDKIKKMIDCNTSDTITKEAFIQTLAGTHYIVENLKPKNKKDLIKIYIECSEDNVTIQSIDDAYKALTGETSFLKRAGKE